MFTILSLTSCTTKRDKEIKAENYDKQELYKEAIKEWSIILDEYPEDVYALTNRGVDYHYLGRFIESRKDLLKASGINKQNIVALSNLSDIYLKMKKYDSALYFIEKCIAKKTKNDVVIELLVSDNQYDVPYIILKAKRGFIYYQQKKYDSSYRDLVYAFNRGYTFDSIEHKIDSIKTILPKTKAKEAYK